MNLTLHQLHHPLNTTYRPRPPPFPTQSQKRYQISRIKKEKFKANTTSFSSEIVLSLHRSVLIFISPSFCTCIHNMFICPPRSRLCRPLGGLPYNHLVERSETGLVRREWYHVSCIRQCIWKFVLISFLVY